MYIFMPKRRGRKSSHSSARYRAAQKAHNRRRVNRMHGRKAGRRLAKAK